VIIVSRIIHVQVDRRLNVTNKFKYQRRLSSRLAIVMFRGTPCSLNENSSNELKNCSNEQYIYSVELLFISTILTWYHRAVFQMKNSSNEIASVFYCTYNPPVLVGGGAGGRKNAYYLNNKN